MISSKIVDKILEDNPDTNKVFDLFGGGGAITFELAQREQITDVIYNDINTPLVLLLQALRDGLNPYSFPFITRKEYKRSYKRYKTLLDGFAMSCYSYHAKWGRSYFIAETKEHLISILSKLILSDNIVDYYKYKTDLEKYYGYYFTENIFNLHYQDRRLFLERLSDNLEVFVNGVRYKGRVRVDNVMRMRRLETLKNFDKWSKISLYNKSYEDILIEDNSIIYCDIPYTNVTGYEYSFDINKFYKWVKNIPAKIYISSYEFFDLDPIFSVKHRRTNKHKLRGFVDENLYLIDNTK
jgi:site-specific DNA-adenine methylase